jgi:hypothetical protein
MMPLIEFLKNWNNLDMKLQLTSGLGSFQIELLGILYEFMSKKDIKVEDRDIVGQGLSIWMGCLASDPKLLTEIYDDFGREEGKASLPFSSILIEKGLVSSDYKLRDYFAGAIRFIVQSVKCPELPQPPLHFLIRLLLSKLEYVQKTAVSRHTAVYFALLKELLPQYFDEGNQGEEEVFDPQALLKDTVNRLYSYEPTEKRSSLLEDFTLIGLLDIIKILIERCPDVLEPEEFQELAVMILEQCLFSTKFEPIAQHITQDVNLEPIERK